MRKFFTQDIGTNTLKFFNYFMNRYYWIGRNKNMNMVRHNFKSNNLNSYLSGFISNNLYKPTLYFTYKDRASSLRTEYQMIVYKIYMMFAMFIFHVDNILYINNCVKRYFERKLAIHPLNEFGGFLAESL